MPGQLGGRAVVVGLQLAWCCLLVAPYGPPVLPLYRSPPPFFPPLLLQTLSSPLSGILGDRYDRVLVMSTGAFIWGVMTSAMAVTVTLRQVRACVEEGGTWGRGLVWGAWDPEPGGHEYKHGNCKLAGAVQLDGGSCQGLKALRSDMLTQLRHVLVLAQLPQ